MAALYLACKECGATTRIEKLGPATQVTNTFFCPVCGGTTRCTQNQETDYWYALAESINLPASEEGAAIVKAIYASWDTNEHSSFRKYVEAIKSGA